jgi:6-phosphogluconolactonase (cycloisomerase 2 family)
VSTPVPPPTGAAAITFNSAGTFAYVPNFSDNTISVFSVNATTGALTASGSPIRDTHRQHRTRGGCH